MICKHGIDCLIVDCLSHYTFAKGHCLVFVGQSELLTSLGVLPFFQHETRNAANPILETTKSPAFFIFLTDFYIGEPK